MSRSLILAFLTASAKYNRLTKKIRKSIQRGQFWRLTRRKRQHLLHKLENLKRRLCDLKTQAKLAGAGLAMAAMLASGNVSAQTTTIGPFVEAPLKNPLPPPAFPKGSLPSISLKDLDKDGDLDAVLGSVFADLEYHVNTGTKSSPLFEGAEYSAVFAFYFNNPVSSNASRVAFTDVDDDGDYDLLIGYEAADAAGGEPDPIFFYRNDAEPGANPHFVESIINPFDGILVDAGAWPAFSDIDNDGDEDLVLSGLYNDKDTNENAFIQVFKNNKEGHEPGIDASYLRIPSAQNPLYFPGLYNYVSIAFADIDEDGDEDFIYTADGSTTKYKRNDNGVFVEQTGPWTYNEQNPGATTGNPFGAPEFELLGLTEYRSFSFGDIDNDGDLDAVVGVQVANRSNNESSYVFLENKGKGNFSNGYGDINPISGFMMAKKEANTSFFFDYDHDGDDDIVVVGSITSGLCEGTTCEGLNTRIVPAIFYNENNVYLPPTGFQLNPFPSNLPERGNVKLADVDGDGDADMVVTEYEYDFYFPVSKLHYYENTGSQWVERTLAANPFQFVEDNDFEYTLVDFGDIDNDGLPDMVLTSGYQISGYRNEGTLENPQFVRHSPWDGDFTDGLAHRGSRPKLVDLDNDGDLDITLGKYTYMWYYENQGNKSEPGFVRYIQDYPYSTQKEWERNPFSQFRSYGAADPNTADIDGDGDKDLLFSDEDGTFGYYENQNPAPIVVPTHASAPLQFGSPMILDSQMTISDPDGDKMTKIVVSISPYEEGVDVLKLTGTHSNMQATFDSIEGTLTITPINTITAVMADFQAALRAVEYTYGSGGNRKGNARPKPAGRTINKQVTFHSLDADLTIAPGNTTTFTLTHSNDQPTIGPGVQAATYESLPVSVVSTITVSDNDDANLSSATIRFINGYNSATDRLEFNLTGFIGGTFDIASGTMTLTGSGSIAQYENALRAVQYSNLVAGASGTRQLEVSVNDGENSSNVAIVNLNLVGSNAAPVLAPTSSNLTYASGNLILYPAITVNDDGTSILSARVGIDTGYVAAEDRLLFTTVNGITGTFDAATGSLALTGSATPGDYQAAIRTIAYTNIGTGVKTKVTRYLNLQVNDGTNNSNVSTVVLGLGNSLPIVSGTASSFYTAGASVVNGNVVITDPDDANLSGATVVITSGLNASEDLLLFNAQNGITGVYTANNGTLALSGTSTVANYQAAIRSVRYQNSSSAPSTTDRVITISVTDGGTPVALGGSIIVINKPPVITSENKQTSAGGNIALSTGSILSDPDNNLDLTTLVVTSKQGASVSINNGIVTINYSSLPDYKGNDELTITVCDTGGRCRTTTISVEVGADPVIYSGFSPNGDGVNDWFHIQFVPKGTQVSIYNRWGDVIFETDDYDNDDSSKRFEGKNKNGTEVISGSYFYKIKYPDPQLRVKTGYLLLNR
jgi:gliding motility-associated-like protein